VTLGEQELLNMSIGNINKEKFKDTKGLIRSHRSTNHRQWNDEVKMNTTVELRCFSGVRVTRSLVLYVCFYLRILIHRKQKSEAYLMEFVATGKYVRIMNCISFRNTWVQGYANPEKTNARTKTEGCGPVLVATF
jgi:hypothetical protein